MPHLRDDASEKPLERLLISAPIRMSSIRLINRVCDSAVATGMFRSRMR